MKGKAATKARKEARLKREEKEKRERIVNAQISRLARKFIKQCKNPVTHITSTGARMIVDEG